LNLPGSDRKEVVVYKNSVNENIYHTLYDMLSVYATEATDVYFENNIFTNISGLFGGMYLFEVGNVFMINNTFTNSNDFNLNIYQLNCFGNVVIDGHYSEDIVSDPGSSYYLFLIYMSSSHFISVNDFTAKNITVDSQTLFGVIGNSDFSMTNSAFEAIRIGADGNMVNIDGPGTFELSGTTMTDISNMDNVNTANYMVRVNNMNLDSASDSSIDNVEVTNSSIGFLYLMSVRNAPPAPRILRISGVTLKNSEYAYPANLFNFERISTSEDFSIEMSQINFEDLSFTLGGNLIYMYSQFLNGVNLINSSARNIKGGSIHVEAFNKQNLTVPAKLSKVVSL